MKGPSVSQHGARRRQCAAPLLYPDLAAGQPLDAKKAEVRFRRDLCRFRVHNERLFEDEFDDSRMIGIFRQNIRSTLQDLCSLADFREARNVLEVGAECCQRATAIESQLNMSCWAMDLSLDSLQAASFYAPRLGLHRLPTRVCCDITAIPVSSGSFDLTFSYQTLHHFSDPRLVLKEIRRVTRQVYVGIEEPTCRHFQIAIRYKRRGIYHPAELKKGQLRHFMEEIFARRYCNEIRYGVIENDRITLRHWRRMLDSLFECEWYLGSSIVGTPRLDTGPVASMRWILTGFLTGAVVSWVARPRAAGLPRATREPELICPDCLLCQHHEVPLDAGENGFSCAQCRSRFPVVNGVLVILPASVRLSLYPEIHRL